MSEKTYEEDFFPVIDEIDRGILMHRDAHFGGNFLIMIDYYEEEGKGVQEEFPLYRIKELEGIEREWKENLAAIFLSGADMEKVVLARKSYQEFKAIYASVETKSSPMYLVADLILSEEEEPSQAIEAIVQQGEKMVPFLMSALQNPNTYDPLFPGYGKSAEPLLMALKAFSSPTLLKPLFMLLSERHIELEEHLHSLLRKIGKPAEIFLIDIIKSMPVTNDSYDAAVALLSFASPMAAEVAIDLLKNWKNKSSSHDDFIIQLIYLCEHLSGEDRSKLQKISTSDYWSQEVKEEMEWILSRWK